MSIIDTDNITPYNDGYMDGENNIKEELINNVSNWLCQLLPPKGWSLCKG